MNNAACSQEEDLLSFLSYCLIGKVFVPQYHIPVKKTGSCFSPYFAIENKQQYSVCLQDTKKMPLEPGPPLAAGYNSVKLHVAALFLDFIVCILLTIQPFA